ncbi:MAG: signal peptide peptidase SppA [Candidatus Schekmanbacteria bacterium]|nr:signal peptide peptidase SppA [Candidatus Schekmanbacteria bacterium]
MDLNNKKRSVWTGVAAFFGLLVLCFVLLMLVGVWMGKRDYVGPDKIALVRVEGVIADSRDVLKQLDEYHKNDTVKAILLRIDSPGGGVAASQEIYQAVKKITEEGKQKVVVSMGSVAASGGYYIACAADSIIANPGTITGSIGVIMEFANIEELIKKVGVKTTVVKTGPHKDLGSPTREMTPEDLAVMQEMIDDVYDQFLQAVSEGRDMEIEQIKPLADGRIYSGRKAKELGLIDDLGNINEALEVTAQMAGITARPLVILEEKERNPVAQFLEGIFNGGIGSLLPSSIQKPGLSLQYRWQ